MALATVTLNDKYTVENGRVYFTGVQALARLLFDQSRRVSHIADQAGLIDAAIGAGPGFGIRIGILL